MRFLILSFFLIIKNSILLAQDYNIIDYSKRAAPTCLLYPDLGKIAGFRSSNKVKLNPYVDYVFTFVTVEGQWFVFDLRDGSLIQRWMQEPDASQPDQGGQAHDRANGEAG